MNYCDDCHTDLEEFDCNCRYQDDEPENFLDNDDCCFGNKCCMSYTPHTSDECHTAEMVEALYTEMQSASS